MRRSFTHAISPFVQQTIERARAAQAQGNPDEAFALLEEAHVIGQSSTRWHVHVHILMLFWAVRHGRVGEVMGQLPRILGAATKTALGLVPAGNTGGSNVSPFKRMPIAPAHQAIINQADALTR